MDDLKTMNAAAIAVAAGVSTDLSALDPRNLGSAKMEIKHPLTKRGTGQFIWLYYNQHPKVQDFLNGEANAEMSREAERQAQGKDPKARTVEEGIERTINMLCVATDRWEGVSFNGETDRTFTIQAARELYALPYIRLQCVEFMKDLDNFMKG